MARDRVFIGPPGSGKGSSAIIAQSIRVSSGLDEREAFTMARPETKEPRRGLPPIVWIWIGGLAFWLAVSGLVRPASTSAHAAALAAPAGAAALVRYVNDFDRALRPGTRERLEAALAAFETETSTQVAVAIYPRAPDGAIEDFGIRVADLSRLGRRGLDNGAILYVFAADRAARLEVGYGLEGTLTDLRAHRILEDTFAPAWSAGDRDGAVERATLAILDAVRGDFRAGKMPGRLEVLWRQVRVELPRRAAELPRILAGVPLEGRVALTLFGGFLLMGLWDGLRQARAMARNAWITAGNLRAGRAAFGGTAATAVGSAVDSMKVLLLAGCLVAALAGVVIVAGGGAFGSAGSTLHW
jgi:uncharacterized membrane protein YgcG